MRQIVANAGGEPSVVLNKVLDGKGNYGFNAQTEEYGDSGEDGDPGPDEGGAGGDSERGVDCGVADHHGSDGCGEAEEGQWPGDAAGEAWGGWTG